MRPDDFRRLAAAGLTTEQIAIVMEMMDREARAHAEESSAGDERRKADQRARWRKWKHSKDNANVSQHEQRLANNSRERVTPVEDKLLPTEIEPQVKKEGEALTREALDAYSAMAASVGLAVPRAVTAGRRSRLQAVIREHGLPAFLEAVAKVGASSFCRGENERGWKADLDFILQAKSFPKILEGHYDDRRPTARAGPRAENVVDVADRLLEEMRTANVQPRASSDHHQALVVTLPEWQRAGNG